MPTFIYQAKNPKDQMVAGEVQAEDEKAASHLLWENKLKVLSIQPKPVLAPFGFLGRVTVIDKSFFIRQLSTMISAGLHLSRALKICSEQTKNKRLKEVLELVTKDVEEGHPLSSALSKNPDVFDSVFTAIVKAGEATGKLEQALESLADRLEKDARFIGRVRAAMVYPIFVLCMILVVGALMMIRVIPQLKSIFEEVDVQIPWTTRVIIWTSDLITKGWWAIILAVVIAYILFRTYTKTEEGARRWADVMIHIPVLGELEKSLLLTRFLKTFALLVKTGIPLLDALHLLSSVIKNEAYQKSLYKVIQDVEKGVPLSVPLSKESNFPPIVAQMIGVGEQSGKLDEVLERLGNYYEEDVDRRTKKIGDLVEPIVIVVLGIGVGILFAGILMPIYQIAQM